MNSRLRVVDASESVAGQFCGKLFAESGATVTLAEPPPGSVLRARPSLFAYLNSAKRATRQELPVDTLETTDVLILSAASTFELGARVPSGLIVCTITEFGAGPRASWSGSELIHQALSGLAYTTGERGRDPLYGFGQRAYYSAGAAAFATSMAAVIERTSSGSGQDVEVSVAETAASMAMNMVAQHEYNGTYSRRSEYPGPLAKLRCGDGWIVVFVTPGRWPGVCAAFGMQELRDDPRFATGAALIENWTSATAAMAAAVATDHVQELVRRGQAAGFAVAAVLDVAGVLDAMEPEQRARWEQISAPPLDDAVLLDVAGQGRSSSSRITRSRARGPAQSQRPAPLKGLRVLELTTAWAGPMTGRSLAFLGAEVIKVESRASIDAWRGPLEGGDVRRYPGLVRGARPYDRSATFNSQNTDKRSVELDLKSADGLTAMRHLVERSDVLICNIAPGALTRLGLDYPGLVKLNAGLVLLEITGFGASGAMSRHVAVGPTVEASAGMMTLLGYGDGIPQNTGGAYLDPVAALVGTGAVLSALAGRAGSGHGAHIELSLRELALSWIGEYLVESLATGRKAPALGNRAPDAAPHGVYRCAGDDEWIGIAVTNDAQWQALCGVLGRIDLAEDPLLMTASGRHAEHERIDAEIRSWCLGRDKHLAADQLQAAGIAAAGLATGADLASDPHLIARGFLHELHHPETGIHRYPGLPYRLLDSPGSVSRAAPTLGQDNAYVLQDLLAQRP